MRHQGTTLLVHRLSPLVLHWLQSPWGEDRDEAYEGTVVSIASTAHGDTVV